MRKVCTLRRGVQHLTKSMIAVDAGRPTAAGAGISIYTRGPQVAAVETLVQQVKAAVLDLHEEIHCLIAEICKPYACIA